MALPRFLLIGLSLLLLMTATPAAADSESDAQLAKDVHDALGRFQEKDHTFKASLEKLVGYAIFPEVAKGGFVLGGAGGRGEVYERGKLIGHAHLSQGTIGAQIGGQKLKFLPLKE